MAVLGKKILIGALQIAGGHGASQALSFIRNLVIARLLGPEQFGVALTFVLLVTMFEMAADLSCDKFIIQDKRGTDPRLQSTLHLFMVVRGLVFAGILFVAADAIAGSLGAPAGVAWAYQAIGVALISAGFIHLDVKRYHRELRYYPDVASQFAGNAVGLVVGVGLAFALGDYRAMLVAILARFVTVTVVSHLFAERSYRIGIAPEFLRRAWQFGWPLMVNGFVLFAASQGDRALIVRFFGLESLGLYGAVAIVTHAIGFIVLTVFSHIGLPLLAATQETRPAYDAAYKQFGSIVAVVTVGLTAGLFATLPDLLPRLFGHGYEIPPLLTLMLVTALAIQVFRGWAIVAALALGASTLVMIANILRTAGLGIAIVAIAMGGDIIAVAACQALAETIATVVLFAQLRFRFEIDLAPAVIHFGIIAAVIAACLSFEWWSIAADPVMSIGLHAAVMGAGLIGLYFSSAGVRDLASHWKVVLLWK